MRIFILSVLLSIYVPSVKAQQNAAPAADVGSGTAAQVSQDIGEGPWEVGEVAVSGNKNLKPKVIIKTGKAKKGRLYKKSDVSSDVETIMGLGSIENISIDITPLSSRPVSKKMKNSAAYPNQVMITYRVSEKPAVRTIKINGSKKLSASAVKDAMDTKEKDFVDDFRIREDMVKITDKYRDKGYIDAAASYELHCDTAAALCDIGITVSEGPQARIANVEFTGVSAFKEKKLKKQLKNRKGRKYAPKEVDNDLAALAAFYKNNGYADFKILGSSVTFNENRSSVTIRVNLSEGVIQYFGATFFSGNTVYMPSEFQPDIAYLRGKKYNQELFQDTLTGIQNRYADKGYLKAEINYEKTPNEKTGQTDITFIITEHDPIYVGHIDVEGNQATKTYVLRREITQKEGDIFSAAKVRRSQ